jgi:hypothetical protein
MTMSMQMLLPPRSKTPDVLSKKPVPAGWSKNPASMQPQLRVEMPDKSGLPNREQVEAYRQGETLPPQNGESPKFFVPVREQARPKEPPPRIAGVRDPISQN